MQLNLAQLLILNKFNRNMTGYCLCFSNIDNPFVCRLWILFCTIYCGKNGWVPYGQKSVNGWIQWGRGTRETEVRLDGWCEDGLRQQRNDGGGCATMRERSERVECPGTQYYVTEWVSRRHFFLALCSFGPPSRALVVITWRGEGCRYMMRLG